jgi:hypothetical protein
LTPTVNVAVPGPLALAGEVRVIYEALLLAVHEQPADVETAMLVPLPPPAPIDWLPGAIENEQVGAAAAWLTVNVWPAMVRDPLRAPPVLTPTVNVAVPGPLALAGEVRVIHESLLFAVHEQPADVETAMLVPLPPPAPIDWLPGAIENEQVGAAAAWLTVNV